MEKWKIICLLCLVLSENVDAQFADNFSDGDFANNPPWAGDNGKFVVQSGKLKLQAPLLNDEAYLSTASQALHNASWEFYLQMDFNPSSTNLAKIYLASDKASLKTALSGYFVKAGNTADEICLYRQDGAIEVKLIDGMDGRLNLTTVAMKIKVTRDSAGRWQLFSDVGPTGTYTLEGTVTDNTYLEASYAGVHCIYTSTRSDKFWFDDFTVTGTAVPDTSPPVLISATVVSATEIDVLFNEMLDEAAAEDVANYTIGNAQHPSYAELKTDQRTVHLILSPPLTNGVNYLLGISGIKDLAGNSAATLSVSILYFQPVPVKAKDVVFTELLPDPTPRIALPESEFVEIFNRSAGPFDLAGWKLSDGSSTGIFPPRIILPGEYLIVSSTASAGSWAAFGKTIAVSNFPTLNNGGDAITLKNAAGLLIDSVSYNLDWYRDADKQEGGWSLELIDASNPCGEQDNWASSEDMRGGSPGMQNSVFANKPDLTPPQILRAFPTSGRQIELAFSEKLDRGSAVPGNFSLNPFTEISGVRCSRDLRSIALDLKTPLAGGEYYRLSINGVSDCNGNTLENGEINTGLPEEPEPGDIILNEILFNPRAGGVDFVEMFNNSRKFVNISHWKVSDADDSAANAVTIFGEDKLFSPGTYLVFTPDPQTLKFQYPQGAADTYCKSPLPALPDDEGVLVLRDSSGHRLEGFSYSAEWHSVFIKDNEGVSLERIDPSSPVSDRNNWTSASALSGFATPGAVNSNARLNREEAGDVAVIPEIFSPESGIDDFVLINFQFDPADWIANVRIYDQQGRMLKTLASNETLGTEGFFRWEGDKDDGTPAPGGYYIVWFEIFNSTGEIRTFRNRVVVFPR